MIYYGDILDIIQQIILINKVVSFNSVILVLIEIKIGDYDRRYCLLFNL